jgi:hypothetical protein
VTGLFLQMFRRPTYSLLRAVAVAVAVAAEQVVFVS